MSGILIVGGTGHLGQDLVPRLVRSYGKVTCFVRPSSNRSNLNVPGAHFAIGDLGEPASLEAALRGKRVLVSAVYLQDHAETIVSACQATGVQRAIFVSSTSIYTRLESATKRAKIAAESVIANSGLCYTILRPTMIYGTPSDRNMARLIRFLRRFPIVFIPGDGRSLQQPIHVEDVSKAIVDCIENSNTIRKAYNISGARSITFNDVIDDTCKALGVRRLKVHVPVLPACWVVRLTGRFLRRPIFKEEQILRLNEDKVFDHSDAKNDFGFCPRSFMDGICQEAALFAAHAR